MPLSIQIGTFSFSQSCHFAVNDALMTVFLLVAGMEIRREMHEGALSNLRIASLPAGIIGLTFGYIFVRRLSSKAEAAC